MERCECGKLAQVKPRFGFAGQCADCGSRTERTLGVRRTLGIAAGEGINKSANISIVRNPTPHMERMVRKVNRP